MRGIEKSNGLPRVRQLSSGVSYYFIFFITSHYFTTSSLARYYSNDAIFNFIVLLSFTQYSLSVFTYFCGNMFSLLKFMFFLAFQLAPTSFNLIPGKLKRQAAGVSCLGATSEYLLQWWVL